MTESRSALDVVEGIDLSGKTCVITGASSGLGRESARALAAAGARVILAARNTDALGEAAPWIHAEVPNAKTATVQLDLTSLTSVRTAASEIREATPVIDILMNNAGVMFTPFSRTQDGFEIQLGTNHFGHFEFTRLLSHRSSPPRRAPASSSSPPVATCWVTSTSTIRTGSIANTTSSPPTARPRPRTSCTRKKPTDAYRSWESALTPFIPARWPPRWLGTCRGPTSLSCANLPSRIAPHVANHRDGYLDFTTPEYGSATQVWAAVSPNSPIRAGCTSKTAVSAKRSHPTHTTPSTLRTCGLSPRSCVRQREQNERRKHEVREKILAAAFDLFLAQGAAATKIEEICERADVANRTFFNHFATRQDMIRALAERRLVNLHDVFFDRGDEAIPVRLIGVFDDIAVALSPIR